jgi:hypothetical protein
MPHESKKTDSASQDQVATLSYLVIRKKKKKNIQIGLQLSREL